MNAAARPALETAGGAGADGGPLSVRLTDGQQASLARLGCAVERPGGLAVLCGPAGSGVTTVLRELATAAARQGPVAIRSFAHWESADPAAWPDIVIADDVHEAADAAIGRLLARVRARHPGARVVLGGRGRVFTLLARDPAVESQVSLRAVLQPFVAAETAALLAVACSRAAVSPDTLDAVAHTIHEISAGAPAMALRLAELALLVAATHGSRLQPDDVETLHRRVSLTAA